MSHHRRFIIELHDVAAARRTACERMLRLVPERLRADVAVLLVPDWYGERPQLSDAGRWLADWPGTRVLHGLRHTRGVSAVDAIWYGTEDESECASLGDTEARQHLTAAVEAFVELVGDRPHWYCAPRWQASEALHDLLHSERIGELGRDTVRPPIGDALRAPAIWFDDGPRPLPRAFGSVQRAGRTRRAFDGDGVMRVVLHPRDAEHMRTVREIDGLFRRLDHDGWRAMSLAQLEAAA